MLKKHLFFGYALIASCFITYGQQSAESDTILIHIEYCRDPVSENCFQIGENNTCEDGLGMSVLRISVFENKILMNNKYDSSRIKRLVESELEFLQLTRKKNSIKFIKKLDSLDYENWYYSYTDSANRRQILGVMLPKLKVRE